MIKTKNKNLQFEIDMRKFVQTGKFYGFYLIYTNNSKKKTKQILRYPLYT